MEHYFLKFSNETISEIKQRYELGGISKTKLAEEYDADYDTVDAAIRCEISNKNSFVHQGITNQNHKLTEAEVNEIKRLIDSGMYLQDVADIFGISRTHAWRIKHKMQWKHILEEKEKI